jgi:hypothetical protein
MADDAGLDRILALAMAGRAGAEGLALLRAGAADGGGRMARVRA